MKREFLKNLELEDETIDKIMSEYGKSISNEKAKVDDLTSKLEDSNTKIAEYETKITNLEKVSTDSAKVQEELEKLKTQIADRSLNDKIIEAIGDKKFVNDFTKNAIIDEVRKGLNDEANKGKSISDILTEYTDGKEGIFVENESVSRATGMQNKGNSVPSDDGVMAILKAKHPEINFD